MSFQKDAKAYLGPLETSIMETLCKYIDQLLAKKQREIFKKNLLQRCFAD